MKEVLISNIHGEDEYGQPIFIDRIYGSGPTQRLIHCRVQHVFDDLLVFIVLEVFCLQTSDLV